MAAGKNKLLVILDDLVSGMSDLIDRSHLLTSLFARLFGEKSVPHARQISQKSLMGPVAAVLTLALIGAFFFARLADFSEWPPKVYSDESVYNLTKNKIEWDVYYGKSPSCGAIECHLTESYPQTEFLKTAVLPMQEFPLRGYKNGDVVYYRARIRIPPPMLLGEDALALHTIIVFAKAYQVYINEKLIYQGGQETMLVPILREAIQPDGTLFVSIKADPGTLPYQGVSNRGDLVVGPRDQLSYLSFFYRDAQTSMILLYVLPKLAFCVVFSVIFLFVRQAKEIPWFVVYGLVSVFELYLRSEFSNGLPLSGTDRTLLGLLTRNISFLVLFRFVLAFFRVHWTWMDRVFSGVVVAFILSCIVMSRFFGYETTGNFLDVIGLILKPAVLFTSIFIACLMAGGLAKQSQTLWRSRMAVSFAFVISLGMFPMIGDLIRIVNDLAGYKFSISMINYTAVFDLFLFTFMSGIVALEMALRMIQQREATIRLQALSDRLELASTVQSNLLPMPMNGDMAGYRYWCRYEPADRLAGDWLYVSHIDETKVRFFLGDVTGKGPAAAIAMSAIMSLLRKFDFEPVTLESLVKQLNKHIAYLFKGNLGSALSVVEGEVEGTCRVMTFGAVGWFHLRGDGGVELIQSRGGILGTSTSVIPYAASVKLERGDRLIAFSDGCLDGVRYLKKLHDDLLNQHKEMSPEELYKAICKYGIEQVNQDDKTFICVERVA